MNGERLRRLDLLLPEEHPIFRYPKGARSKVAREWLELGASLSEIKEAVIEIKETLKKQTTQLPAEKSSKCGFDEISFTKRIGDLFG